MKDIENNMNEPLVEEHINRINQVNIQIIVTRMILLFSASASITLFIYIILTKN